MATNYAVVLVHRGLDDFAQDVRDAVRVATTAVLLDPDLIVFKDDLTGSSPDDHTIVAYLANKAGAADVEVGALMADALAGQVPVLPLSRTSELGSVSEKLPYSIRRVNAIDWDARRGEAINAILVMLGLAEPERRVFLSYYRKESTPLAVQLHTALAQARFDVFLDRFTVPPAVDFQQRLERTWATRRSSCSSRAPDYARTNGSSTRSRTPTRIASAFSP